MSETPSRVLDVIAILVKTLLLTCVCNSRLQDRDAELVPLTRIRDYSDVTVVDADGRHISRPEVSHFDEDAKRDRMCQTLDPLYTFQIRAEQLPDFLERIDKWIQAASRWDDPKLDNFFQADRPAPLDADA